MGFPTAVENMDLTLGEAAEALGTSAGITDRTARGYSIDSRTLAPGQLFFAIRGPRFDGHDFVAAALARGAAGAVVAHEFWQRSPAEMRPALLSVPDTTKALQHLG